MLAVQNSGPRIPISQGAQETTSWRETRPRVHSPLPYKPDSVPRKAGRRPFLFPLRERSEIPRTGCDYYPGILIGRATLPLFCLAPRGVYHASSVTIGAVGSYPTISTLPVSLRTIGGLFSAALSVRSGLHRTVPRFHKARCPLVSGLSSKPSPKRKPRDRPGSGVGECRKRGRTKRGKAQRFPPPCRRPPASSP